MNHPLTTATSPRRRLPRTSTAALVCSLVVKQLARRESRILSLTVAVRRAIGPFARVADLGAAVESALDRLSASGDVTHVDGMYVLTRPARLRRPTVD